LGKHQSCIAPSVEAIDGCAEWGARMRFFSTTVLLECFPADLGWISTYYVVQRRRRLTIHASAMQGGGQGGEQEWPCRRDEDQDEYGVVGLGAWWFTFWPKYKHHSSCLVAAPRRAALDWPCATQRLATFLLQQRVRPASRPCENRRPSPWAVPWMRGLGARFRSTPPIDTYPVGIVPPLSLQLPSRATGKMHPI
jgi:hypothetical protein